MPLAPSSLPYQEQPTYLDGLQALLRNAVIFLKQL
jgi:hypothetical protein